MLPINVLRMNDSVRGGSVEYAAKCFLLLLGSLMLLGGGGCVVSNVVFLIQDWSLIQIVPVSLSFSAVVAVLGWWAIKKANTIQGCKSGQHQASDGE
ncbi:hypothetical protein OYT1_ch0871 [Ferriphaselus amnicola]|uniref:Uncharacterized protein n=1 Tax=Ferriphaselus amnicola TaxID=1188319 RepID=A0A2Z6GAJ3_9PROT|nr:hypothetical protein [Ferriphaselus amnicola]BBE50434.1 hypothetical protein OYT1_ch0871 [Ferriphaselus amnicola]